MSSPSNFWRHFDRLEDTDGNVSGKCHSCGLCVQVLGDSTDNLAEHLSTYHPSTILADFTVVDSPPDQSFEQLSDMSGGSGGYDEPPSPSMVLEELDYSFLDYTEIEQYILTCPGGLQLPELDNLSMLSATVPEEKSEEYQIDYGQVDYAEPLNNTNEYLFKNPGELQLPELDNLNSPEEESEENQINYGQVDYAEPINNTSGPTKSLHTTSMHASSSGISGQGSSSSINQQQQSPSTVHRICTENLGETPCASSPAIETNDQLHQPEMSAIYSYPTALLEHQPTNYGHEPPNRSFTYNIQPQSSGSSGDSMNLTSNTITRSSMSTMLEQSQSLPVDNQATVQSSQLPSVLVSTAHNYHSMLPTENDLQRGIFQHQHQVRSSTSSSESSSQNSSTNGNNGHSMVPSSPLRNHQLQNISANQQPSMRQSQLQPRNLQLQQQHQSSSQTQRKRLQPREPHTTKKQFLSNCFSVYKATPHPNLRTYSNPVMSRYDRLPANVDNDSYKSPQQQTEASITVTYAPPYQEPPTPHQQLSLSNPLPSTSSPTQPNLSKLKLESSQSQSTSTAESSVLSRASFSSSSSINAGGHKTRASNYNTRVPTVLGKRSLGVIKNAQHSDNISKHTKKLRLLNSQLQQKSTPKSNLSEPNLQQSQSQSISTAHSSVLSQASSTPYTVTTRPAQTVSSEIRKHTQLQQYPNAKKPRKTYVLHPRVDAIRWGHKKPGNMRNIHGSRSTRQHCQKTQKAEIEKQKQKKLLISDVYFETAANIRNMMTEKHAMNQSIAALRRKRAALYSSLTNIQYRLPESGAAMSPHPLGLVMQYFLEHVRQRSIDSWKYWLLACVFEPLVKSFDQNVSDVSLEDLYHSGQQWCEYTCYNRDKLRQAVDRALRYLSTETDLLSNPPTCIRDEMVRIILSSLSTASIEESASSGGHGDFDPHNPKPGSK